MGKYITHVTSESSKFRMTLCGRDGFRLLEVDGDLNGLIADRAVARHSENRGRPFTRTLCKACVDVMENGPMGQREMFA